MAKRQRKAKTEAEMAAIEADRIAAAEGTGPYALTHEQAIQGANLASGVPVDSHSDSAGQNAEQFEVEDEPTEEDHEIAHEIFKDMNAPEAEMTDEQAAGLAAVEEALDDEEKVPNSIVKDKFKVKYIENAQALGLTSKAAKRSNWDWLSQMLAAFCLNDKGKIDIGSFTDVLDANGVDHSRWQNRNKGWEGRFRMTGRVALQKVVANSGVLKWPGDLEATPAPAEWAERFKTKS